MITSENIFKLVKTFERLYLLKNNPLLLDMAEFWVHGCNFATKEAYHECGTIHCHAGWYYIAKRVSDDGEIVHDDFVAKYGCSVEYQEGVSEMAEDLGYEYRPGHIYTRGGPITTYFKERPDLWGNEFGIDMFCHDKAFGEGQISMKKIIEHWGNVGLRVLTEELYREDKNGRNV